MKRIKLLNWMLFALIAFGFTACDNEPLEGDFVTNDPNGAGSGEFIATVNGASFLAENAVATMNNGDLLISGIASNGDVIMIAIANVGECTYDLERLVTNARFVPSSDFSNPYLSFTILLEGGEGTAQITSFDAENLTVSGTFSFIGVRPVNGATESLNVTEGSFTDISLEVLSGNATPSAQCPTPGDDDDGGDGGDDPTDPADSFFANVDGEEFVDTQFVVNETVVGGVDMLNVIATRANGGTIRIDIPRDLGVGIFDFNVPISDGTDLIAIYTDGDGGESMTPSAGFINITEFSSNTGKLAATFNFEATNPLDPASPMASITDGEFNIDFIPGSGGVETVFTADIDEMPYEYTSLEVTQEPFNDEITLVTITTVDETNNRSLTLRFPKDITVGTYEMSPSFEIGDEKVGLFNPDIGSSLLFASNPGILTISSYELSSGIIEGTFSFTAMEPNGIDPTTYEITNGTFVVNIP